MHSKKSQSHRTDQESSKLIIAEKAVDWAFRRNPTVQIRVVPSQALAQAWVDAMNFDIYPQSGLDGVHQSQSHRTDQGSSK